MLSICLSVHYCKENFRNSESFRNSEMIKTDKFGKRNNLIFFVFFNILTMKISFYYETVFRP